MLGALNAITHDIVTITNDGYIDAQSVIALLQKLRVKYQDVPITLVLDNVPYQRCSAVREVAESLHIDLLYLPPYSPNLNLIERLWRYVKKDCLKSKYHTTFDEFKAVIMDCINSKDQKHRKELHTLLTLKFQMFPKNLFPDPKQEKRPKKSRKQAA